jgi:hypothetical protein
METDKTFKNLDGAYELAFGLQSMGEGFISKVQWGS